MLGGALTTAAALYVARAICPNPAAAFPSVLVVTFITAIFSGNGWSLLGWLVGVAAVLVRLRSQFKGKPWLRPLRWQSFLFLGMLAGMVTGYIGFYQAEAHKWTMAGRGVVVGLSSAAYLLVASLVAPAGRVEVVLLAPILSFLAVLAAGSSSGVRITLAWVGAWMLGSLMGGLPALWSRRRGPEARNRTFAASESLTRYKGTAPYQDLEVDRNTFFGRDQECRQVLSMVLAERLLVLFSKSGMGKSSLINAGIVEPLRRQGYLPVAVRLNNPRQSPLTALFEATRSAVVSARADQVGGDESSAFQFFKTAEFWSEGNDLLRPVLILDQFEELFTLQSAEARRVFVGQLAELLRGRTPAGRERASGGAPVDDAPPDIKIVIALREEFVANLQDLAEEIPAILHNRFRLGPLSADTARAAIVEPARLEGGEFQTARFSYEDAAVDRIVSFLARKRQGAASSESEEVEPVQLQLICHYLEETVRFRQQAKGEAGEVRITEADLGGEEQMQQVLEGFYDRTIEAVRPRRMVHKVRHLCEKRLISEGGRRLTEDQDEIAGRYGISADLLRQLVDARLLRAEPRLGSTFYEVSHDRLVDPIRQSSRKRRIGRIRLAGTAVPLCLTVVISLAWLVLEQRHEESRLAENLFSQDATTAVTAANSLLHKGESDAEILLERAAPVMNPAALAAAVPAKWTEADATSALRHIETTYRSLLVPEKPVSVQRMVLLGALVATLDDLAAVPEVRERAVGLREKVIAEFRQVYNIGTCSGARDAVVSIGEWERCIGGDARLVANSTPKYMNWYQAKGYAALRGGKLLDDAIARNSNSRFDTYQFRVMDGTQAAFGK